MAELQNRENKQRFNIFRNDLFRPQALYTKVPLHFEFFHKPTIILDHTSSLPTQRQTISYHSRASRGRSHKIFQKRLSVSSHSGILSTSNNVSKKDTITSQWRLGRNTIFRAVSPQPVPPADLPSPVDLVSPTANEESQESSCAIYENPAGNPKGGKQNLRPKARHLDQVKQQYIYTPEQLRQMKCKGKKNKALGSQPLSPLEFRNMARKVTQARRVKKEQRAILESMPVSPFYTREQVSRGEKESLIYRI